MTTKELLYIDDALGHAQYFRDKCRETISQIQDAELKNYVEEMEKRHEQLFRSFYGLL